MIGTLENGATQDRHNNFDAMRLAAAISVIFSHAFLLAEGGEEGEPLMILTGGQCVLGVVGVFVFFTVSGYLITQSFGRTGNTVQFLMKRAFRIYPGYLVCILVLTFGLGAAATALPLRDYLRDAGTWEFLGHNLWMDVDHNSLPGVWFSGGNTGNIVDGPLWSLPCEMVMYLIVAILGACRVLRLGVLPPLMALGLVCLGFDSTRYSFIGSVGWLLPFFVAGMFIQRLGAWPWHDRRLALMALRGLVLSIPTHLFLFGFAIFGSYLVLYLALHPSLPRLRAARFGDLSYGLYIYGWPVEQAALRWGGPMPAWTLFLIALPITALLALISWHLVEKIALRLKPTVRIPLYPATL